MSSAAGAHYCTMVSWPPPVSRGIYSGTGGEVAHCTLHSDTSVPAASATAAPSAAGWNGAVGCDAAVARSCVPRTHQPYGAVSGGHPVQ